MLRRLLVAAALMMMAACDGNPGDDPGDTYVNDTSNGKGDNPNPTDTTTNDTTVSDTNVPDSVQVEDPCKDLYQYAGFYYGYDRQGDSDYDDTLTITPSPSQESGMCDIALEASAFNAYMLPLQGQGLPVDYLEWDNVTQAEYLWRLWQTDHYIRVTLFEGTEDTDPITIDFWFVKSQ